MDGGLTAAIIKSKHTTQVHDPKYHDLRACTALDLNVDGTSLTSNSALRGPVRHLWEIVHGKEIIRLIDSKTVMFIHRCDMPSDKKVAYYNPQLKIKLKNGSFNVVSKALSAGTKFTIQEKPLHT